MNLRRVFIHLLAKSRRLCSARGSHPRRWRGERLISEQRRAQNSTHTKKTNDHRTPPHDDYCNNNAPHPQVGFLYGLVTSLLQQTEKVVQFGVTTLSQNRLAEGIPRVRSGILHFFISSSSQWNECVPTNEIEGGVWCVCFSTSSKLDLFLSISKKRLVCEDSFRWEKRFLKVIAVFCWHLEQWDGRF